MGWVEARACGFDLSFAAGAIGPESGCGCHLLAPTQHLNAILRKFLTSRQQPSPSSLLPLDSQFYQW